MPSDKEIAAAHIAFEKWNQRGDLRTQRISDDHMRAILSAAEQVRASEIKKRLEYWRTKDLHNGWRVDESGPCCCLCEMRDEHFTGRADALKAKLGCRDPFQVNCGCHLIPRQAVKNRMIEELSSLANTC